MSACELASRSCLQVFLEFERQLLVVELHDYQASPRAIRCGMWRQTSIVCCEAAVNIRCQADVIRVWTADALDDVDEPLGVRHHTAGSKLVPSVGRSIYWRDLLRWEGSCNFCDPWDGPPTRRAIVRRLRRTASARKESGGECDGLPAVASRARGKVRLRGVRSCAGSGGQPPREKRAEAGEPGRNRTFNLQIKSLLLCQLSYGPTRGWHEDRRAGT